MQAKSSEAPLAPSRWSLRFPDREVERAFLARFAQEAVVRYRLLIGLVVVIWLGFGLLDHHVLSGDQLATARLLRFGLVTPILVGSFALSYAPVPVFARYWQLFMAVGYAAISAAMIYYAFHNDEPAMRGLGAGGIALVIVAGYTLVMMRFVYAVTVSALVTVALASLYALDDGLAGITLRPLQSGIIWVYLANVIGVFSCRELELFRRSKFADARVIERERERAEALLANTLPRSIAERLKNGAERVVDGFESVTVLFGDLVGFTELAERLPPEDLVDRLNELYSEFDALAERYGLEKIKTMGDAYMVVGGVPSYRDDHAEAIAAMALDMCAAVAARPARGHGLEIRIGIHTGPVVAGVIGTRKLSYDVWGDTVNIASRLQSHGVPGAIQVSESTRALLAERFAFEPRGRIALKGKGATQAFLLVGRVDKVIECAAGGE